ncbi:hypothetical protein ACIPLC_15760 [Kitasatospora sp. NPDC086801]|uniref:hypothetical protein n=1 Tax=Kitasatospora sp. NPDC086801 TaxID=3364066 RepID=UPI00381E97D9
MPMPSGAAPKLREQLVDLLDEDVALLADTATTLELPLRASDLDTMLFAHELAIECSHVTLAMFLPQVTAADDLPLCTARHCIEAVGASAQHLTSALGALATAREEMAKPDCDADTRFNLARAARMRAAALVSVAVQRTVELRSLLAGGPCPC